MPCITYPETAIDCIGELWASYQAGTLFDNKAKTVKHLISVAAWLAKITLGDPDLMANNQLLASHVMLSNDELESLGQLSLVCQHVASVPATPADPDITLLIQLILKLIDLFTHRPKPSA